MATIVRRKSSYQAKIRRKGFPTESRTFDTRREAIEWARSVETQMDTGIHVDRGAAKNTTLEELLTRYRAEVTPTKRGAKDEKSRLNVLDRDPISSYSLDNLTPAVVKDFCNRRLENVSGSTVNRDLALLSAILNHAVTEWSIFIPLNPVSQIKRPANNPSRERRLYCGEEDRLIAALSSTGMRTSNGCFTKGARNIWMLPLVLFALETAMRRSDLLRLEWRHIDLKRRTARISISKNGSGRTIPLSSKAVEILSTLPRDISGRVFPISINAIKHSWKRALDRANIEDLHFHDLRHEATSRLFEKGLGVMEVASITGHKDPRILQKYVHLFAEDLALKLG